MRGLVSIIAAMAGALCLMPALAPAQGVITLDHAVRNCRLIGNKEARLACYDRVIDEADASVAPQAAPAPVASATPPAPVAAPPASPPKAAAPVQAATAAKRSAETPVGDALKVASAKWGPNGSIVITMGDGTVWRQVDATDLRLLPKAGEALSVSNALFGKSICEYDGEPAFDCRQE